MKTVITTLVTSLEKKLSSKFDELLSRQYAWWIIEKITHKNELVLINQKEIEWSESDQKMVDDALNKIIDQDMPLAYWLESIPFCGLDILVKPPILIPRPETEEWCARLIEQLLPLIKEPLWILDLCSGSGCIALALADALPKAKVYGIDINDAALALAQENARHNHIPNVTFLCSDLFKEIPKNFTFDLIVANPPYIAPRYWQTLDKSVTQWEDKNALIAPDDGLALIKHIINDAIAYLKPNAQMCDNKIGQLLLEIDYLQGQQVKEYMLKKGYNQIMVQKDLQGQDRVVSGRIDNVATTFTNQ